MLRDVDRRAKAIVGDRDELVVALELLGDGLDEGVLLEGVLNPVAGSPGPARRKSRRPFPPHGQAARRRRCRRRPREVRRRTRLDSRRKRLEARRVYASTLCRATSAPGLTSWSSVRPHETWPRTTREAGGWAARPHTARSRRRAWPACGLPAGRRRAGGGGRRAPGARGRRRRAATCRARSRAGVREHRGRRSPAAALALEERRCPAEALPEEWQGARAWLLVPVAGELGDDGRRGRSRRRRRRSVGIGWQGLLREFAPTVGDEEPRPSPCAAGVRPASSSRASTTWGPGMALDELQAWRREAAIVLTAGEGGGVAFGGGAVRRYRALPAAQRVDATGAGDVFLAALTAPGS